MEVDSQRVSKLPCVVCGKFFTRRWLERHMKSFHSPDSDDEHVREPCKQCGKLISSKFLARHWKQAHPIGGTDSLEIPQDMTKEYCPVCGKLIDCCYLHTHIKAKHPDSAGSFKDISYRRVSCPVCGYEFSVKAIKRHLIESHQKKIKRPDPKDKQVKCNICSLMVTSRSIARHRARKHPIASYPMRVKLEQNGPTQRLEDPVSSDRESTRVVLPPVITPALGQRYEASCAIAEVPDIKFEADEESSEQSNEGSSPESD
mmetsp:Transcript_20976/g.38844  ORF Transcript_20976/g.38844 Transcript_20976/m.38844 type:complete len:259 (-) Transcript_20976:157-933(-)